MMHVVLWSRFGLGVTVIVAILSASAVEAQNVAPKAEPAAPGSTAGDQRAAVEASGKLEEIVVTARKWSEDVQSIPGSVDVIGSQALADAHVTKLDDLANLVSNLNIVTRGDNNPDVVLRGVGSFGVVQGVGFYANDVQLFDGQTVRPDDLERVEVLKGPQGTLYGGSNIGGAIKYITKLPTDQFEAKASVEAGNYDSQTYSGVLSGPLSPGVLDGRASFFHTTTGGFIYDTTLGRYVNNGTETGGRLTLLNTMESTITTLYLSANRNRSGVGANLYYTPGIPEDPAAAAAFSLNVRDGTLPEYSQDLYSAVLNIQHQFSEALTLTSISSWFHSNEKTTTDTDKGPFPILTGYQLFHHEVWSEEVRLASNMDQHLGPGTLRWIFGAFAQGDNPDVVEQTVYFTGTDFTDPTQTSNPANFASTTIHPVQHHQEYALFGNAMYDWGRWGFQAGLRGDYHWSSMSDPLWGVSAGQHNLLAMPLFSASYHFEPSVMGYATISRGFEPGDFAEGFNANNTPMLNPFRPETIWNYELGVKSTLFDRVRFNTAVFYMNYQGRLFQTNVLEAGTIIGVTENIGPSHNYGAEFDLTTRIVPELYLNASFGFTRAIWGSVPYLDTDLGFASGVPAVPTNLNGRFVDFTPAYQGSLTLEWSHNMTGNWTFGARPSVAFFGREYWDPTDHYHQPAYHLVNFNLRLDNKHWDISANVSNVFNKLYNTAFISAAELAAPFNSASIGRPRLWSGTVAYRW